MLKRASRTTLGVSLLLSVSLVAQVPKPAPPGDTIRGRVVDGADSAALRRAQVAVTLATSAVPPVMTDDTGAFTITVPPGGAPRLRVTKAGYAPVLAP
jgi:hypothetical protein